MYNITSCFPPLQHGKVVLWQNWRYSTTLQPERIMGTNTYQLVAATMDNLTMKLLDQAWAVWMRNKQMFGKLGEMFLESGRSYNPQFTVGISQQKYPREDFFLQTFSQDSFCWQVKEIDWSCHCPKSLPITEEQQST